LILQAPKQGHLFKGDTNGANFDEYSQLPPAPDRDHWWPMLRRAVGFVLYVVVDLHIRQVRYHEATDAKIEELRQTVARIQSQKTVVREPVLPRVEVEKIEAEGEPPVQFVPGATWDPFKE
jgi:hypothetical protein